MDPYLERYWGDVHATLIVYAKDALQGLLTGGLRARAQERVVIEDPDPVAPSQRFIKPDVMVVEYGEAAFQTEAVDGGVAVAEPLVIHVPPFETTHRYLEIIDVASGDRVVTIIEFLSPTNKRPGDGRDKYQQERDECIRGRVNFVEIDLTREGPRELSAKPWQVPVSHQTEYQGCVFRAARPDDRELYAMPLWKPLPTIKVPLRSADPDVLLPLQPLIDDVYERGRYDIDYRQPCRPPLDAADAAELERRLAE
jgi:hypothetical protein